MRRVKVSIIIVYYSKTQVLFSLLDSIYKANSKTSFEIVIVDNSKHNIQKKLKSKYRKAKYLKSPENLGYAAGNNLGARVSRGEYLFILNPDTIVYKNTIDLLVAFLKKNNKRAIVAPSLIDKSGNEYSQIDSKALTPVRGIIRLSLLNKLIPLSEDGEVEVVAGSAFMIRKSVFEKVGGFDENLFLFFEENDLCKRVREAGYKIAINPKSRVRHDWVKDYKLRKHFINSRFYFFRKHYGIFWAIMVEMFARIGFRSYFRK